MSLAFLQIALFTLVELALCYMVGRLCYATARLKYVTALHHAIAPALGLAAMALQLWLYGLVHVPWNVWLLLTPWAALAILHRKSLFVSGRQATASWRRAVLGFKRLDLLAQVLVVLGVIIICVFLVRLCVAPLISSDTMGFWALKARAFFHHQSVFVDPFFHSNRNVGQFFHADYPPLWPLMADVGYVLAGHVQEAFQKTASWILYLSAVTAVWAFAREQLGNSRAIVLSFVMLAAPQLLNILFFPKNMAYADLPVAVMMLCATLFLLCSLRSRPDSNWLLALLFASLAAVTKNEGLPFLLLTAVVLAGRLMAYAWQRRDWRRAGLSLLAGMLALLPPLAWTIYKKRHHLEIEFAWHNLAASGLTAGERLGTIAQAAGSFLKTQTAYWWEISALLLGAVGAAWQRSRESGVLLLLIVGMLVSYIVSFVFSAHDVRYHVSTSIDRLLTQLLPLLLVLIAVLASGRPRRDP